MADFQIKFEAIGTHWLIDLYEESFSNIEKLDKDLKDLAEDFNKVYSRFRDDSLVAKISKNSGSFEFPERDIEFLNLYDKFYRVTDGKFTLLIGKTLDQAGYNKDYCLTPQKIEKLPKNSDIFTFKKNVIEVKKPFLLDFGGLGKGYLISLFSGILESNKIYSYTIDGSGDILHKSKKSKSLRVGLENPNNLKQVIGVIEIVNESICSSSGSRRKWANFHHIIDPDSLSSPKEVVATWVVSKDPVLADGIATSLFFTKPEKLLKEFKFEYLILNSNFTINRSEGFRAEIFFK